MMLETFVFEVIGPSLEEDIPERVRRLVCSAAHKMAGELYMHDPVVGVAFSVVCHLPHVRHKLTDDGATRILAVKITRTGGACVVSIEGFVDRPARGQWTIKAETNQSSVLTIVSSAMLAIADLTGGTHAWNETARRALCA